MRRITFLLALILAAPAAMADDVQPTEQAASAKACRFTTNNCESCGFDDSGKLWCTPSYFGCTVTSTTCLIEADGARHPNG